MGAVQIWQVLGGDDPLPCLLISQISYPVAQAFLGEVKSETDPRLFLLRASFGTRLTQESFWAGCGRRRCPFTTRFGSQAPPGGFLRLFLSPPPRAAGKCCAITQVTHWFRSPVGNKLVPVQPVVESHPQQPAEAHVSPQILS